MLKRKSPKRWERKLQHFGATLTFIHILLLFAFCVVLIFGSLLYKALNENKVNQAPAPTARLDISNNTKAQLTTLVRTSPLIKFIMVTEVDLKSNQRLPTWWYLNDINENQMRLQEALKLPLQIFNNSPKNTEQMVRVLNNEFTCSSYSDSIYYPRFDTKIATICEFAIPPPRFGLFAGIITFGLDVPPTMVNQDSLRLEASRIAVQIYLRGEIKEKK